MRLSEAIREGAKKRPQARGEYVDCHGATCAIGAVAHAVSAEMFARLEEEGASVGPHEVLYDFMPEVPMVICPGCDIEARYAPLRRLDVIIVELNDFHEWTREQIADWLAGQGL